MPMQSSYSSASTSNAARSVDHCALQRFGFFAMQQLQWSIVGRQRMKTAVTQWFLWQMRAHEPQIAVSLHGRHSYMVS